MQLEDVTVEVACKLLELPRTLGNFRKMVNPFKHSMVAMDRTLNARRKLVTPC